MANSVVIGSQWGDEGKAKVIDYLTEKADIVVRYQGGANAGHTVIVDGKKFVFHMLPSGIISAEKICVIANGVVFDAQQFLCEVDDLSKQGVNIENRLFVSDIAHLVLPYHKIVDCAREEMLARESGNKIGTTGRGIGPAYSDKSIRCGIRTGELLNFDMFVKRFTQQYNEKKNLVERFYKAKFDLSLDETIGQYREIAKRITPLLKDTAYFLFEQSRKGKKLLFEGAQGNFLDIDHGTYPFVTSSNTSIGSVSTGSGVAANEIDEIIGIVKAYTTRVGNGPFPTELFDEDGVNLQTIGGEKGATTGRARRCGWLDTVLIRKSIQLNGFTKLAITKLDVLNTFKKIKICTKYEIDSKIVERFPTSIDDLAKAKPIYEEFDGWECLLDDCKSFDQLPENAKKYLNRLKELCYGVEFNMVSIGADRNQTIGIG
ncbi:MAG: adenylosuccinate synthase [Chitinispirillales bacterium]|jgi:adenylosuccinate synthase|nr:adenylosuccinate synthase [Chitinispirillales bacterium]